MKTLWVLFKQNSSVIFLKGTASQPCGYWVQHPTKTQASRFPPQSSPWATVSNCTSLALRSSSDPNLWPCSTLCVQETQHNHPYTTVMWKPLRSSQCHQQKMSQHAHDDFIKTHNTAHSHVTCRSEYPAMHVMDGDKPHFGQPRLLDHVTCKSLVPPKNHYQTRFRMNEELQASQIYWLWQQPRDFSVHHFCVKGMTASLVMGTIFNSLYNSAQYIIPWTGFISMSLICSIKFLKEEVHVHTNLII